MAARVVVGGRGLDVLAATLSALLVLNAAVDPETPAPTWLAIVAAAVAVAALWWRIRLPEPVLAVTVAGGFLSGLPFALMLAMATVVATYGRSRRSIGWVLGVTVLLLAWTSYRDFTPLGNAYALGVVVALPVLLGLYLRSQADLLDAARQRTEQLEAAAAQEAEAVRIAERARIAREMHDVVAHRVSLIALHAGGLEVAAEGTDAGRTAGLIRETAHAALQELRGVIGVLRMEGEAQAPEERTPAPTLADVPALVGDWERAGSPVRLSDASDGASRRLGTIASRAVYRVVQESLTNASKHAPGAPVEVRLHEEQGVLAVEVCNGGATRSSRRADSGAGVGLFGLRERLDAVGGSLVTEEDADGFTVRALVPVEPVG